MLPLRYWLNLLLRHLRFENPLKLRPRRPRGGRGIGGALAVSMAKELEVTLAWTCSARPA